jgi:hypothetical protein
MYLAIPSDTVAGRPHPGKGQLISQVPFFSLVI